MQIYTNRNHTCTDGIIKVCMQIYLCIWACTKMFTQKSVYVYIFTEISGLTHTHTQKCTLFVWIATHTHAGLSTNCAIDVCIELRTHVIYQAIYGSNLPGAFGSVISMAQGLRNYMEAPETSTAPLAVMSSGPGDTRDGAWPGWILYPAISRWGSSHEAWTFQCPLGRSNIEDTFLQLCINIYILYIHTYCTIILSLAVVAVQGTHGDPMITPTMLEQTGSKGDGHPSISGRSLQPTSAMRCHSNVPAHQRSDKPYMKW